MSFYRGKKVFIVGGSKGIGRALAEHVARQGASVWVAARGEGALQETVDAMKAVGSGPFGYVSMDVTDFEAVQAGAAEAVAGLGGLDVLVCNSGFAVTGTVADSPLEHYDKMMSVNFMGHVHAVKALLPHFTEQGAGDICLVSSMMGFLPLFGYPAYSASKFAIIGFGESLRQELKGHGVRVTMYYPPTTKTPGLDKENEGKPPEVWALESESGFNKTYEADQVAANMARSIEKGVVHGMIGSDSKFIYTVNRLLPGLTRYLTDDEVKKAKAKASEKG